MMYKFIYESNAYAVKHKLAHCPRVEVVLIADVKTDHNYDSPLGPSDKRPFVDKVQWLSAHTEYGVDIMDEYRTDLDMGKELVNECHRQEDAIINRFQEISVD